METRHFVYAFALAVAANIIAQLIVRRMITTTPVLAFSRPSGCGCGGAA